MIEAKFLDSNILIYAFDESSQEKRKKAEKCVEKETTNNKKAAISTQIIAEFFTNITKKVPSPIPLAEAKRIVEDMISMEDFIILTISSNTILSALEIVEKHKISYWDAQIVAVMKENGISTILTENTKDFNVPGIVAVNPFK